MFVRFTQRVPDSTHLFRLTVFEGVVTRVIKSCFRQQYVKFLCSRCKYTFDCEPLFQEFHRVRLPPSCPRPNAHCNSSTFVQVHTGRANPLADNSLPEDDVSNYCEVRVSEVNYSRNSHRLPRSIWVGLEDDLVGVCKPGDEVQVLYGKCELFFFYTLLLFLRVLILSVQWCSCLPLPTIARGPAC